MKTLTFRKLVKPEDLNPAQTLFGGRMMAWIDEAAALFVMCQLKTSQIVTLKVSELIFKEPVKNGNFLEFYASTKVVGKSSITVHIEVFVKDFKSGTLKEVVSCELTFVHVDEQGRSTPHFFKS